MGRTTTKAGFMQKDLLESGAVSAFCESVAIMLSAGIQTDEAVHMLGEKMEDATFKRVCDHIYKELLAGKNLAEAMESSGAFPEHALNMVRAGEETGRTESVLRGLAVYYDEESRLFAKVQSSIAYPAALLCVMSVILLFTVLAILPVFMDTYASFAGTLTSGSFLSVNVAMVIGWAALVVTLIVTIVALLGAIRCRSVRGRISIIRTLNGFPATKQAMYQISLSRFTSALSTYVASGIDSNVAMREAMDTVDNKVLYTKLEPAYTAMLDIDNTKSLAQAIYENNIFEPVYARMLMVGTRSGSTDEVLDNLSSTFFDDAVVQMDRTIDSIEPALAAFMTLAVGATLLSVMLPLIGIMGSIG